MGGIVMRKIKKLNSKWQNGKSRARSRSDVHSTPARARSRETAKYLCQYLLILVFFGAGVVVCLALACIHSFIHFLPIHFVHILRWPVCLFTCLFYRFAGCFTLSLTNLHLPRTFSLSLAYSHAECFHCGLFFRIFFFIAAGLFFSLCVAVVLSYNHNLNVGKVFCLFSFILCLVPFVCEFVSK